MDLLLSRNASTATLDELAWLDPQASMEGALEKLEHYFPDLSAEDFRQAVALIGSPSTFVARLRLARRFKRVLGKYRRYGTLQSAFGTAWAVARMLHNRKILGVKHMRLLGGGAVIALVGPQATGKTTLATALQSWLGAELGVRRIHAGKPPATILTKLPNMLIPLARSFFPRYKTENIESRVDRSEEPKSNFPWIFVIRKVLVALDRRALLRKAFRWARNGRIVLSDRYPSDNPGAVDGKSFSREQVRNEKSPLKRLLMSWERRIYQDICPPDLVLELQAPTEVAVVRNEVRNKVDAGDEGYVRRRHAMRQKPKFEHCAVVQISTDRGIEDTLKDAKKRIWSRL
jgi:thymidylate kinase